MRLPSTSERERVSVSSYWLDDPGSPFTVDVKCTARPFGLPTNSPTSRPKPFGSSRVVRPSPGLTHLARQLIGFLGYRPRWLLSWSLAPLRRLSTSEFTPPRFATPGTFRPQGFSPSRRLTPRPHLQPCFRLVTPLGFPLSRGFPSLLGSASSSPRNAFLAFHPRDAVIITASIEAFADNDPASRITPRTARLQGFAPTVNPYSYERNESNLTADPLLSFPPL
jgi:hypothetical protein